jgi:hypothetical protein
MSADPVVTAMKVGSVFIPEITPLAPRVVAALATLDKLQTVMQPALDRAARNEPAVLEMAGAAAPLMGLLPEIRQALAVLTDARALAAKYQQRIAAATEAAAKA